MLNNKKISSQRVRKGTISMNKTSIYFPNRKVDKTKTQAKIPNKTPWPACNEYMDRYTNYHT